MKDDKYQLKVRAVLMRDSGIQPTQICRELHITMATLHYWYALYQARGEESLRTRQGKEHLGYEKKVAIVEDIVQNHLSLKQSSVKYLVPQRNLKTWLKAYRTLGPDGLKRKGKSKTMIKKKVYSQSEIDELTELRRRNEWLEAENAMLKKAKALVEAKRAQQRANGQESSKN